LHAIPKLQIYFLKLKIAILNDEVESNFDKLYIDPMASIDHKSSYIM